MTDKMDGKFLKVVSTPEQIRYHPLNNSANKQFCVFPLQRRFPKQKSLSTDVLCYDINRDFFKQQRATGFGYGQKFNFTQTSGNNPSPDQYVVNQHCIEYASKKKGFVFGESRENCNNVGGQNLKTGSLFPGPGKYDLQGLIDPSKKKGFTFRIKTKHILVDKNCDTGPGKYELNDKNAKDKHILSTIKNQGHVIIAPLKKNFSRAKRENPPDLVYDLSFQTNPKGKYFNSKYKNTKLGKIAHEKRLFNQGPSNNVPGPGTYQMPSDFGFYQSSQVPQNN